MTSIPQTTMDLLPSLSKWLEERPADGWAAMRGVIGPHSCQLHGYHDSKGTWHDRFDYCRWVGQPQGTLAGAIKDSLPPGFYMEWGRSNALWLILPTNKVITIITEKRTSDEAAIQAVLAWVKGEEMDKTVEQRLDALEQVVFFLLRTLVFKNQEVTQDDRDRAAELAVRYGWVKGEA